MLVTIARPFGKSFSCVRDGVLGGGGFWRKMKKKEETDDQRTLLDRSSRGGNVEKQQID